MAAACVDHGLACEQEIHWHCFADNRPSARVAEKLVFQLEREYEVYRLNLENSQSMSNDRSNDVPKQLTIIPLRRPCTTSGHNQIQ